MEEWRERGRGEEEKGERERGREKEEEGETPVS